jgi:hypothetical protein
MCTVCFHVKERHNIRLKKKSRLLPDNWMDDEASEMSEIRAEAFIAEVAPLYKHTSFLRPSSKSSEN